MSKREIRGAEEREREGGSATGWRFFLHIVYAFLQNYYSFDLHSNRKYFQCMQRGYKIFILGKWLQVHVYSIKATVAKMHVLSIVLKTLYYSKLEGVPNARSNRSTL